MPKKSLGQHWLFDSKSLGAICDAANIEPTDTILEVGPGLGPLTVELVQRAHKVVAVEFDDKLARQLPARVPAANLTVVHGDILRFDLGQLPLGYKVVANVPYYLTSHLVRLLLEAPNHPSVVVILIQKEVAERIAAEPGDMSLLSVMAQFYAHVNLGVVVTADKFDPPPKVDSQVVVLTHRGQPVFTDVTPKQFFHVVKAGFSGKRKTLVNAMSAGLAISKDEAKKIIAEANVDANVRAEALSMDAWHRLALSYAKR